MALWSFHPIAKDKDRIVKERAAAPDKGGCNLEGVIDIESLKHLISNRSILLKLSVKHNRSGEPAQDSEVVDQQLQLREIIQILQR